MKIQDHDKNMTHKFRLAAAAERVLTYLHSHLVITVSKHYKADIVIKYIVKTNSVRDEDIRKMRVQCFNFLWK